MVTTPWICSSWLAILQAGGTEFVLTYIRELPCVPTRQDRSSWSPSLLSSSTTSVKWHRLSAAAVQPPISIWCQISRSFAWPTFQYDLFACSLDGNIRYRHWREARSEFGVSWSSCRAACSPPQFHHSRQKNTGSQSGFHQAVPAVCRRVQSGGKLSQADPIIRVHGLYTDV